MTKNEFERLLSYHVASKTRPKFKGISKYSAKSGKKTTKYMRRDGQKRLILSIDKFPWRF
jgi:hypothetical protein